MTQGWESINHLYSLEGRLRVSLKEALAAGGFGKPGSNL